jgi:hypothetical protein
MAAAPYEFCAKQHSLTNYRSTMHQNVRFWRKACIRLNVRFWSKVDIRFVVAGFCLSLPGSVGTGVENRSNLSGDWCLRGQVKSSHSVNGLDFDPAQDSSIFIRNFDRTSGKVMNRAWVRSCQITGAGVTLSLCLI